MNILLLFANLKLPTIFRAQSNIYINNEFNA